MRAWLSLSFVVAIAAVLLAGCIVGDSLTTITIRPDGSADVVLFRSNLRSSETGSRAEQELAQYVAAFDAGEDPDHVRLREAGGEIVDSRWIRREMPGSNCIVARLPGAAALERYLSIPDGETKLRTRFVQEGAVRRLVLEIVPGPELALPSRKSPEQSRAEQADGFSETRLAIEGGRILRARGFTVASDRRSALLDPDAIVELLRAEPKRVELLLEWQVGG